MKTRLARSLGIAALAATIGLGFAFARTDLGSDSDPDLDAPPPSTMDSDVEVMLLRIGMTPEVLSAAGLNSTTVQSALAAEESVLEAATSTLASHDADCAEAKRDVDSLRREVRSGNSTAQQVTDLATAKATLATATAARAGFLEDICDDFCENISAGATTSITRMCETKNWKSIPVEMRVVARTEAEWLDLREALSAKKTHEQEGLSVPSEATQLLSTVNAEQAVSTASSDCDSNLAGVQTLWDSVFSE